MSVKRTDLDAGRVDFKHVASGRRLPLIHPGEILKNDFLDPMEISVYALANAVKVPRSRLNDIVLGRVQIRAIRLCVWLGILERRRSFGLTSKRAMIWMQQSER